MSYYSKFDFFGNFWSKIKPDIIKEKFLYYAKISNEEEYHNCNSFIFDVIESKKSKKLNSIIYNYNIKSYEEIRNYPDLILVKFISYVQIPYEDNQIVEIHFTGEDGYKWGYKIKNQKIIKLKIIFKEDEIIKNKIRNNLLLSNFGFEKNEVILSNFEKTKLIFNNIFEKINNFKIIILKPFYKAYLKNNNQ